MPLSRHVLYAIQRCQACCLQRTTRSPNFVMLYRPLLLKTMFVLNLFMWPTKAKHHDNACATNVNQVIRDQPARPAAVIPTFPAASFLYRATSPAQHPSFFSLACSAFDAAGAAATPCPILASRLTSNSASCWAIFTKPLYREKHQGNRSAKWRKKNYVGFVLCDPGPSIYLPEPSGCGLQNRWDDNKHA